jgi:hypothetical protein
MTQQYGQRLLGGLLPAQASQQMADNGNRMGFGRVAQRINDASI